MYVYSTLLSKNTDTVVWKIFVQIYFVVKYFRVNNFRGLSDTHENILTTKLCYFLTYKSFSL